MYNLFEYIPDNFFSFLSGENKHINSIIIFRLFSVAKANNTYTLNKNDVLDIITNCFDEFVFNDDFYDNGQILTSSRDKATSVYRRLKECGWIDDDYDVDQTIVTNFEDYTISILNTLLEIDKNSTFELSSKVYNIYNSLKNIEIDRAYLVLSTIYNDSKELIDKLRSLNSNIKKYIKRIVKLEDKNDNVYLINLFNQLVEYKEKIIDQAYYYMKTKDNPRKYKKDFKERLEKLENGDKKIQIINQIKDSDNINDVEANSKFDEITYFLYKVFDECLKLMDEIDKKNEIYISTSINRINIILNNNKDIEGLLLNILKNFDKVNSLELYFPDTKELNELSLYVSRSKRKEIESSYIIDDEVTVNIDEIKKFISDRNKYSKKKIYNYVENKFINKDILTVNDFDLKDNDGLVKMMLVIIYSKNLDCNYTIEFKDEDTVKDKYRMKKFEIRRK